MSTAPVDSYAGRGGYNMGESSPAPSFPAENFGGHFGNESRWGARDANSADSLAQTNFSAGEQVGDDTGWGARSEHVGGDSASRGGYPANDPSRSSANPAGDTMHRDSDPPHEWGTSSVHRPSLADLAGRYQTAGERAYGQRAPDDFPSASEERQVSGVEPPQSYADPMPSAAHNGLSGYSDRNHHRYSNSSHIGEKATSSEKGFDSGRFSSDRIQDVPYRHSELGIPSKDADPRGSARLERRFSFSFDDLPSDTPLSAVPQRTGFAAGRAPEQAFPRDGPLDFATRMRSNWQPFGHVASSIIVLRRRLGDLWK